MMNRQLTYILLTMLVINMAGVCNAQENEETSRGKLRWGVQASPGTDELHQEAGADYIWTSRKSVGPLGIFATYRNAELSIDADNSYIGANLSYKVYKNWAVIAGGSTGKHWVDIERESYGYGYSYSYTEGEANVSQYYLGVGYHNTLWNRLKIQANIKIGGVHTNKATAAGIIDSYGYYYDTNKKARKTDTYELSPSMVYGSNLYLELLPKASKNRQKPLVPFFNFGVMGNDNSNTSREITIEEWVPGNVVYYEKSDKIKYDLLNLQVQLGVKWYLKF